MTQANIRVTVFLRKAESGDSASDCEETSGVNFCGSQLILELGSLEVKTGVGHSRFVEDDSDMVATAIGV